MSLPSFSKVGLNSQAYLISEVNYSTKKRSIGTCKLLSTKLQQPISEAKYAEDYYRIRTYCWVVRYSRSWSNPPGQSTVYRFINEPVAFYPADPTPAQYNAGGQYYQRTYEVEYGTIDRDGNFSKVGDGTIATWLEPALYE